MEKLNRVTAHNVLGSKFLSAREQTTHHLAWWGEIKAEEAENYLNGKSSGTYLLRSGETPSEFWVSFLNPKHQVIHTHFEFVSSRELFRNGDPDRFLPLEELIPEMMDLSALECLPLGKY
jgi:SH2 domain-containing protein